jgi:hypothetical protein
MGFLGNLHYEVFCINIRVLLIEKETTAPYAKAVEKSRKRGPINPE